MHSKRTELRVGALVVAGVVLLVYLTYNVGGWKMGKSYPIFIRFSFISGLGVGAPVRLAGFRVGEVTKIEMNPAEQKAQVKIEIDQKYQIPDDSRARIDTAGIMGEKYIELSFGKSQNLLLPKDVIIGEEPFDLQSAIGEGQDIANGVKELVKSLNLILGDEPTRQSLHGLVKNIESLSGSLDRLIGSEKDNIHTIVAELADVSGKLDDLSLQAQQTMLTISDLVKQNRDGIASTVENVNEFAKSLKEQGGGVFSHLNGVLAKLDTVGTQLNTITQNLSSVVTDASPDVKNILASVKESSQNVSKASDSARVLLKDIEDQKGVLGKLIRDENMGNKVERTINQVSDKVDAINTSLDSTFLRYRFRGFANGDAKGLDEETGNHFRNDLTLNMSLNQSTFIELGADDIGGDTGAELMFGKHYERIGIRAGVKESEAALALDLDLIPKRLQLSAEGIGLTDSEQQRLDLLGSLNVYKNVSLIGGVQDVGQSNNANLGLELRY